MKKLVTILVALAMILAMGTTAFASEENGHTMCTLVVNGIKDHTYNVFQIYTADVEEENGNLVLTNVEYGKNHYLAGGQPGDPVPPAELNDFLTSEDKSEFFLSAIKDEANPYATINAGETNDDSVSLEVEAGYYLILDVTDKDLLPDGQTRSPIILKVAEDITITSKHATISSYKKVKDENESTGEKSLWQDSADYKIGASVPFQLGVTLPSIFDSYNGYSVVFHDKHDDGFTVELTKGEGGNFSAYILRGEDKLFNIDAAAFAVHDGCLKRENCAIGTCEFGTCDFTVEFTDLQAVYAANDQTFAKDDVLIVEYTAVLNENANVGMAGNENSMYVCHPDGHTPIDTVTVLTYELTVHKIDGSTGADLTGASFTLQKQINGVWENVGNEIVGGPSFTWSGLDDGIYKLVEKAPATYNDIAPIEFEIKAEHEAIWTAGGGMAFSRVDALKDGAPTIFLDAKEGVRDGKLEGTVENFKGVILPETGAEGTFMLVTGGAVLVVLAAVVMITRKKMSIYED